MTFLELRNLSYKLIDANKKERIAYFYLIEKYSSISKIDMITSDFEEIDFNINKYLMDLNRYINGEPIKKIIKLIKVSNIEIDLSHKVLIPRLETEELINIVISELKGNEKVLDLCCGSGIIGLALKKAHRNLNVIMSDIDPEAIAQTKKNAKINNLNVKIIKSDLFENINEKFDVIIFNPPYININLPLNNEVKKYEPLHAIYAKDNGLEFYSKIIPQLKKYIRNTNSFLIVFEIAKNQYLNAIDLLLKENIDRKYISYKTDIEKKIYFITCKKNYKNKYID